MKGTALEPLQILILAAGSSSRMRGADKLLELVDGRPLLARQAAMALATGRPVTVALPPDRPLRAKALQGLAVDCVTIPDAAEGMAASIRGGVAALPAGAVLVLLADLPELTTADLLALIAAAGDHPGQIVRAGTQGGEPGHPVIFPEARRPALLALTGDSGARDLLRREAQGTRLIALPARHALTDLDTPEDWARWRAETGR